MKINTHLLKFLFKSKAFTLNQSEHPNALSTFLYFLAFEYFGNRGIEFEL